MKAVIKRMTVREAQEAKIDKVNMLSLLCLKCQLFIDK